MARLLELGMNSALRRTTLVNEDVPDETAEAPPLPPATAALALIVFDLLFVRWW